MSAALVFDRVHVRHTTCVSLLLGDITTRNTNAIVNAVNRQLDHDGDTDVVMNRSSSELMLTEYRAWEATNGPLPAGGAMVTGTGGRPARIVVHTAGPVYEDGQKSELVMLERAWRNSLAVAHANGARTIAVPPISTGVNRFPVAEAALVGLNTTFRFVDANRDAFDRVEIVVSTVEDRDVWARRFDEVVQTMLGTPATG